MKLRNAHARAKYFLNKSHQTVEEKLKIKLQEEELAPLFMLNLNKRARKNL